MIQEKRYLLIGANGDLQSERKLYLNESGAIAQARRNIAEAVWDKYMSNLDPIKYSETDKIIKWTIEKEFVTEYESTTTDADYKIEFNPPEPEEYEWEAWCVYQLNNLFEDTVEDVQKSIEIISSVEEENLLAEEDDTNNWWRYSVPVK